MAVAREDELAEAGGGLVLHRAAPADGGLRVLLVRERVWSGELLEAAQHVAGRREGDPRARLVLREDVEGERHLAGGAGTGFGPAHIVGDGDRNQVGGDGVPLAPDRPAQAGRRRGLGHQGAVRHHGQRVGDGHGDGGGGLVGRVVLARPPGVRGGRFADVRHDRRVVGRVGVSSPWRRNISPALNGGTPCGGAPP